MSFSPSRRRVCTLLTLPLFLGACGFRLQGHYEISYKTIYLKMNPNSHFYIRLKRSLESGSNIKVVTSPSEAEVLLEIIDSHRNRDILSINDSGRAREYLLTMTLSYRLLDPTGEEVASIRKLSASRDISYSESDFLAREKEEEMLYQNIEKDFVRQISEHLSTLKPNGDQ